MRYARWDKSALIFQKKKNDIKIQERTRVLIGIIEKETKNENY